MGFENGPIHPRNMDVKAVCDIYHKVVLPSIGRDGSWVSGGVISPSVREPLFIINVGVSKLDYSLPHSLTHSQVSPALRNSLLSFESVLSDTSSSCRVAEAARILGEKRVCKVDVDLALSVVFYCLEREELQTALRELSHIVSLLVDLIPHSFHPFFSPSLSPSPLSLFLSPPLRLHHVLLLCG